MGNIKKCISKKFECNVELNKKALKLKKSWDEVSALLDSMSKNMSKKKRR